MKKIGILILAIVVLLIIVKTKSSGDFGQSAQSDSDEHAISEIRKEPKVIEAIKTSANVLYVFGRG